MIDLEFVGDYRNPQPLTARQRELGFDGSNDGEFTFDDFLDIINPLQHIPVISTLYREITGDEISPHARIFGGTLFGGPSGFIAAAANALYEEVAGEDIGQSLVALFTGGSDDAPQFAESGTPGAAPGNDGPDLDPAATAAPESNQIVPAPEVAPPGAGGVGVLTGEEALNALFQDLRSGSFPLPAAEPRSAAPLAARQPATEMKSYPLPPRPPRTAPAAPASQPARTPEPPVAGAAETTAVHPLIFAQHSGEADIAERMMQALDKYAAMSRQRLRDDDAAREDPRWQSDPGSGSSGS